MNDDRKERRRPIQCPECQTEMVCMRLFNIKGDTVSIWYICPRRKGEGGCGYKLNVKLDHYQKLYE